VFAEAMRLLELHPALDVFTYLPADGPTAVGGVELPHADLVRARDSGEPVLSGPLPSPAGDVHVLLTPVYTSAVTPDVLSGRREAHAGWTAAVFGVPELLQHAVGTTTLDIAVALRDAGADEVAPLLASVGWSEVRQGTPTSPPILLDGRAARWELLGRAGDDLPAGVERASTVVLVAGLLLSLALGAVRPVRLPAPCTRAGSGCA
jgi:hypothetical protein